MAKFEVRIEEQLATTVEVEAASMDDAIAKVEEMYKNCEVVLTADDFVGVDFEGR